jgi:hypothetical protein
MSFKFFKGVEIVVNYDRHNTIWKTVTGRDTPIIWMTNSHIINTLGCLRGVGLTEIPDVYLNKTKQEWIEIFKTELRVREQESQQRV